MSLNGAGQAPRAVSFALLLLTLLPIAAPARPSFVTELNQIRAAGCDGRPGVNEALRPNRKLDAAARRLASGAVLSDALRAAGYRALHSASLYLSPVSDDRALARTLAQRSCAQLRDPAVREVGLARRGKAAWIILAAPFAAPAIGEAEAARRVLELANDARSSARHCGTQAFAPANPLVLNEALTAAARAHARDMAARSRLSHTGSDGSSPAQRVTRTGYVWRSVGENVAAGPTTPEEVMSGWLASAHHCENIMDGRFTEMGLAYVFEPDSERGVYWAQVFALPRAAP